jgi:segregation and condensation protein B
MTEPILTPPMDLEAGLEAILFVSAAPVAVGHLAEALGCTTNQVENGLNQLSQTYTQAGRGLSLQRYGGKVQLTSAPATAALVEKFLGLEATARLSRAALEALAIIAYRQPITRPAIDAIRGVNSDGVLKSLLSKGLVQEMGRSEGPGRPILYEITADFLQYFGLGSINELPPYETPADAQAQAEENILKD